MPDKKSSPFWSTLPAILAGLAGLITAGAAVAAIFVGSNGTKSDEDNASQGAAPVRTADRTAERTTPPREVTLADWARQANEICAAAYEDMRALGIPSDPASQFAAVPQTSRISARANQKIQALDRPPDNAEEISELLRYASRSEVAGNNAYQAWDGGDLATAEEQSEIANQAWLRVQELDGELGANVCARGP